ncbi:MAG: hypothetical protein RLN87_11845 [Parasphingopyxis sp.]|uniref:hypothetical protein n=1 Tax=Parasphingopyxis sp. TaxID=1920299 RepID=UPI002608686F|nr:hypothetical protein [uncultured Parasphingopyxis sp.]
MTEERVTERDDGVTREKTVERSDEAPHTVVVEKSGGGAGWVIAIVLIVAVIAGIYFFTQMSGNEALETEAITEAAGDVGDAAQQAGDAAEEAAGNLSGN